MADVIDLTAHKLEQARAVAKADAIADRQKRRIENRAILEQPAVNELVGVLAELVEFHLVGNAYASAAEHIVAIQKQTRRDPAKFDAALLAVLLERSEQLRQAKIAAENWKQESKRLRRLKRRPSDQKPDPQGEPLSSLAIALGFVKR